MSETGKGYTVKPKPMSLVCGYGSSAADALVEVAAELKQNYPSDALLSAVTVFYVDDHYEAETVVRVESE